MYELLDTASFLPTRVGVEEGKTQSYSRMVVAILMQKTKGQNEWPT
jgi:hypothetical protein